MCHLFSLRKQESYGETFYVLTRSCTSCQYLCPLHSRHYRTLLLSFIQHQVYMHVTADRPETSS
jgi:hypothetical protein